MDTTSAGMCSLCFISLEPLAQGQEGSFNSLCMSFKGTLTPAISAIFIGDLDEQPSGKDAEVFNGLDFDHDAKVGYTDMSRGKISNENKKFKRIYKAEIGLAPVD